MFTFGIAIGILTLGLACQEEKSGDSAAWWETSVDDQEEKTDYEDDKSSTEEDKTSSEDKEELSYEDCPEDFDPEAECEGSWEETLCLYDSLVWWCENGTWLNENDK